jgi:hypothetical protein
LLFSLENSFAIVLIERADALFFQILNDILYYISKSALVKAEKKYKRIGNSDLSPLLNLQKP